MLMNDHLYLYLGCSGHLEQILNTNVNRPKGEVVKIRK
jgi:hypothetical protein